MSNERGKSCTNRVSKAPKFVMRRVVSENPFSRTEVLECGHKISAPKAGSAWKRRCYECARQPAEATAVEGGAGEAR